MKNSLIEQTVVLVKPDGVKRALVGEIVSRFEKIGLKIVGMKMVWVDEEMVRKHYPTTRKEWVTKIGEKTLPNLDSVLILYFSYASSQRDER